MSKRLEKGTLRSLSSFESKIDFYSNDYLGFAHEPIKASNSGSTGSRLLSGNTVSYLEIEAKIASFFEVESCLHFNSGYDANLGIFSSIPQKGDIILYDELIHASVRDGARLSWAQAYSFRHNDIAHLEQRLKNAGDATIYIAVEALYSMDGDIAPLKDIARIAEKYKAYLIVDEAHSGGVFGEKGKGIVDALNLSKSIFLRLITFGKAYGSHGACVLTSKQITSFLVNYCRPFIYSTALPEFVVEHNLLRVTSEQAADRRNKLSENIHLFRKLLKLPTPSDPSSPIQVIPYSDSKATTAAANRLQAKGIAVKPIFTPTVPEGQERLRICLHSFNSPEEIEKLIHLL